MRADRKVILLLDGDKSHTSMGLVQWAKETYFYFSCPYVIFCNPLMLAAMDPCKEYSILSVTN